LNSQLQGQQFYTNMLTDLQVARTFLSVFLKPQLPFEDLLKHIKTRVNPESLGQLNAIETSTENLTEIKVRFSQINKGLKGIVPRIVHFMENGWFVFPCSSTL